MSFSVFNVTPDPTGSLPASPSPSMPWTDPLPAFKVADQSHTTSASGMSSANVRGSFEWDLAHGYDLQWSSLSAFEVWRDKEEESKTIELVRKELRRNHSTPEHWLERHIYVCARGSPGGRAHYKKKYAWTRKVPVKRTGCPCRLTVVLYPSTNTVLGRYQDKHSHDVGDQNARFTRLPKNTRKEIERLLRLGVEPNKVVCFQLITPCMWG